VEWTWVTGLQLFLAIVGIIGNFLVILVYKKNIKLRSPTNTLIAALALADLFTSILCIPHPTLSYVPENGAGLLFCRLVHSKNIMWITIVASIFTLTMTSIERWVAVVYPTKYKDIFTMQRTKLVIAISWMFSFFINTVSYYVTFVEDHKCVLRYWSPAYKTFLGIMYFLVEYFVPMALMMAANLKTIQALKLQAKTLLARNESLNSPAFSLLRARRRVIEMLLIVILTFFVCWTPDQIFFLLFNVDILPMKYLYGHLYYIFVVLAYSNSCMNPIIYAFKNKNFRKALMQQVPSRLATRRSKKNVLFETPSGENKTNAGTNHVLLSRREKATKETLA
jgi:mu-type opioid receptor